jgi:hypothetical protein
MPRGTASRQRETLTEGVDRETGAGVAEYELILGDGEEREMAIGEQLVRYQHVDIRRNGEPFPPLVNAYVNLNHIEIEIETWESKRFWPAAMAYLSANISHMLDRGQRNADGASWDVEIPWGNIDLAVRDQTIQLPVLEPHQAFFRFSRPD